MKYGFSVLLLKHILMEALIADLVILSSFIYLKGNDNTHFVDKYFWIVL